MDKALISRRFAKAVGTYLDKADVQRYVASRMAELTGRYIPSDIQERVLEIGCGTGMFTRMYLQQAAPEEMWLNTFVRRWNLTWQMCWVKRYISWRRMRRHWHFRNGRT